MEIIYNDRFDLLYIRFDPEEQEVVNKRIADSIVLDIGRDGKVIGIEILDASKHVNISSLIPVKYRTAS
ncbi:MAG: DUF2283 domain-containing protein [Caldiserica bacterium]|nr:MAG: DUF2283 domain-containing protein [Caldisericota bacterium]